MWAEREHVHLACGSRIMAVKCVVSAAGQYRSAVQWRRGIQLADQWHAHRLGLQVSQPMEAHLR